MLDDPADLLGTLIQPFFFNNIQDRERSRTAERASRICAPEFTRRGGIKHFRPADDAAQRQSGRK